MNSIFSEKGNIQLRNGFTHALSVNVVIAAIMELSVKN